MTTLEQPQKEAVADKGADTVLSETALPALDRSEFVRSVSANYPGPYVPPPPSTPYVVPKPGGPYS